MHVMPARSATHPGEPGVRFTVASNATAAEVELVMVMFRELVAGEM
jgi:hypothetical protein